MTNREQYAVDLSPPHAWKSSFETALLHLATDFLNLPVDEIDDGIARILAVIGGFSGADCAGLSELDLHEGKMRELQTWTRPGCAARGGAGEAVDISGLADLYGDYDRPVLVSDAIEDARLPDGLGQAFADFGVRSLAWVPVSSDERHISAVGFTSAQPIEWSEDQVSLLELAGKMISNLRARWTSTVSHRETSMLLEELGRSIENHFFMWAIDPPRFLYSNDAIETLSGWPVEEFKSDPTRFVDVILPEYRKPFDRLFQAGRTRPAELEYEVRHADGSTRWLRTRVFPGTAANGREPHIAGLTEDITERVAIVENEARFRAVEAMLSRISGRFVEASHGAVDAAISDVLAEICQLADVERGQVYLFDGSRQIMREISRWQAVADLPGDEGLRAVPRADTPYLTDSILSGGSVSFATADELPESAVADRAFLREHRIESCLIVPLASAAQRIGALVLTTLSYGRSWADGDVSMLKVAGGIVAAAVERRRSERELEEAIDFERLITSLVSRYMNLPASELDEGIGKALETIARFVDCDRTAIYFLQDGGGAVLYRGWWAPGVGPLVDDHERIDTSTGTLYGDWLRSDEPHLLLTAPAIEALRPDAAEVLSKYRIGAVANVPIVIDGERVGWFSVGATLPRVGWTEAELRSLSLGADALANMNSRRLTEEERRRHEEIEEILSDIAADFIKRPLSELRAGIEEIVDRFGKFAGCDRAGVLLVDQSKRTASTYYEWVNRGEPDPVQDFPIGDAPSFYSQMMTSTGPWIMHVEDFPDSDRAAAVLLEAIGVRTLLNCPIVSDGHVFGYASIGYPESGHHPVMGTARILDVAAGIIANALSRECLEQQALVQHQALSRAFRIGSLAQLATGIAHELNQPLAAIANYTRACIRRLESGEIDAAMLADLLERVSDESLRAGDIVRNLRAHVKGGPRERSASSVRKVVDHACSLLAGAGRDHGVTLLVEYAEDLPRVDVDPTEIEQVVINLVQNAIDSISLCGSERREVRIMAKRNRAFVEIEIVDSGPGFREEDVSRIFEEFHTTKQSGLGLGLSISRELIESNGGTLAARTSPHGATFRITLPVASAGGIA